MSRLGVLFLGSGAFGLPALKHMMSRDDVDIRIITQPDRPAGRGRKTQPTPVAEFAADRIPVKKYPSVNEPSAVEEVRRAGCDLMIVCDFGQIIKSPLLAVPRVGPFNLHGSVLPAYRGAAPIQRAILDGVPVTGVTLLRVNERCDAGPIIWTASTPIRPGETFGELHPRLAELSVTLLEPFLDRCASGSMPPETMQDDSKATMAPKIKKEELCFSFDRPASEICRRVLAFSPSPGAYVVWKGSRLKVLRAAVAGTIPTPTPSAPGTIRLTADRKEWSVTCASGEMLRIDEVQFEGSKPMSAREALNGHPDIQTGALIS